MLYESRQTRLGQPATEKYRTISADLTRQYDTHLEKTHKSLPAIARLRVGRGSRAGLQADLQTPGSPPPLRRRWSGADAVTPTAWRDGGELPVAEAPVTLQPRSGRLLIHSQLLLEDSIKFHSSFAH